MTEVPSYVVPIPLLVIPAHAGIHLLRSRLTQRTSRTLRHATAQSLSTVSHHPRTHEMDPRVRGNDEGLSGWWMP